MVDRLVITPSKFTLRNAYNNTVFDSDNKYIRTSTEAAVNLSGFLDTTVIYGGNNGTSITTSSMGFSTADIPLSQHGIETSPTMRFSIPKGVTFAKYYRYVLETNVGSNWQIFTPENTDRPSILFQSPATRVYGKIGQIVWYCYVNTVTSRALLEPNINIPWGFYDDGLPWGGEVYSLPTIAPIGDWKRIGYTTKVRDVIGTITPQIAPGGIDINIGSLNINLKTTL